ncbi:MAG: tRNA threonylcarbamoyladenosine dehydratase [Erysipelotrichaceae bacterium]|nr:tRNA threonylcarbamoyladenosine dehydratase [Erysipelotrichaceae bacterium]
MTKTPWIRLRLLLSEEEMETIRHARVAVFGLGGVGGQAAEALVRSGIGAIDLIDNDDVDPTNMNRQILATHSSIGRLKVDVSEERFTDINPDLIVRKYPTLYLPEQESDFDFTQYDYVVDCIDTVTAKLSLIEKAKREGCPVISSMGTGNRFDPSKLLITDISKTHGDPLAKVMRRELKKRGICSCKVLFSTEEPHTPDEELEEEIVKGSNRRSIPGSTPFVPPAAGLLIASEVIRDLIKKKV